ncbi:hypothetical protein [Rhodoferax antarcticus]|uniref:hypothetical protein n=1 Tax=Rhodoferax antarcticus TaxID=81479 RepID=UPI001FD445A5|nr:hypothetical protein [Rhodoferax antarcticus]
MKDGVFRILQNQQYGHAADQGAKLYAAFVRKLAATDKDGVELANFFSFTYDTIARKCSKSPTIPVNDLSTDSLRNVQEGQGALTRGLCRASATPLTTRLCRQ